MIKTTALKIIQTFSQEEVREFTDFLNSPFHNKKSGIAKLFNVIKGYYPDYRSEDLRKENIWNKLFGDKKFNYGVMKNLIYGLTRMTEDCNLS